MEPYFHSSVGWLIYNATEIATVRTVSESADLRGGGKSEIISEPVANFPVCGATESKKSTVRSAIGFPAGFGGGEIRAEGGLGWRLNAC